MVKRKSLVKEAPAEELPEPTGSPAMEEGGLFAPPPGSRAMSIQNWPELETMGLQPREVRIATREDGSVMPFCPYSPYGLSGLRTLLRVRKTRKATSERFMNDKGLPVRHGMKITYGWTDEQGEDYVGDAYVLWENGEQLELIKSASAVRDLDDIVKTIGPFPWKDALPLRIVKVPTRSGHYCLSVEVA